MASPTPLTSAARTAAVTASDTTQPTKLTMLRPIAGGTDEMPSVSPMSSRAPSASGSLSTPSPMPATVATSHHATQNASSAVKTTAGNAVMSSTSSLIGAPPSGAGEHDTHPACRPPSPTRASPPSPMRAETPPRTGTSC